MVFYCSNLCRFWL